MHSVGNVLIVGAGMCGMSLGVALRRAGINCEIVEIRPELTEPGTGISDDPDPIPARKLGPERPQPLDNRLKDQVELGQNLL